jgi:hypothetical protein
MDTAGRQLTYRQGVAPGTLAPSRPGTPPMNETELERERHRALVAEGLAAALTEAARRVSGYLQAELQRPDWEGRTARKGWKPP